MTLSSISYPKPSSETPVGFGPDTHLLTKETASDCGHRRLRRELLERYFSPIVSEAVMPSTVDRLVLWRSHHGRHHA